MSSGFPRPLARFLKGQYFSWRLRALAARPESFASGRTAVAGFLSSPFGLGVGARLVARGLAQAGMAPSLIDIAPQLQPDRSLLDFSMPHDDDGKGPVIIHVNPPELVACLAAIGPDRLRGRRLIGYWAWEQSRMPESWVAATRWLDEIWVPSEFVRQAVQGQVSIPVYSVGYPAGLYTEKDIEEVDWRGRLGLAADSFLALSAFDPRSNIFRKNPQGAVEAFKQAFLDDDDARLVLKATGHIEPSLKAELTGGDPRIIVQEGYLSTDEMLALIGSADCIINLHRAEGYGLLPVQALCLGVPAIMTGWSSVTDFADCPGAFLIAHTSTKQPFSEGHYDSRYGAWAEPSIDEAAAFLRQVRQMDRQELESLGKSASAWWRENHSPSAFLSRLPQSTRNLFTTADKQETH
ncbi:glycosyltransferase family 4 protein [Parvularcula flava]|uniref:Glycosyltransferase family 4 protein n=1 Tax=Aquisalinus luteolus TaxID=1566827 RepID=A0A8J3ESM0_9PROT|nr:hypothetical protein [Aquisalinus luteolus]NHK29540.1 glycosyltransferase family 4 protein [Aquisalinus luteolus]GGI01631.1 hypothetical protein GCM10011355_32740 [Aquisalinus luteolus]